MTMLIARIEGATRTIGKSQGYLGLPLRDEARVDPVSGSEVNVMTSAWQPTPAELAALVMGATIHVSLFGEQHPPILVAVGPLPGGPDV
jgi:hypothetical protein